MHARGSTAELYSDAVHTQQCCCLCACRESVMHACAIHGIGNRAPCSNGEHPARNARPGRAWIVNTMPTKPAVSSATPSERGPTSFSCSTVLRRWILPAQRAPPCQQQPQPLVSVSLRQLQQDAPQRPTTPLRQLCGCTEASRMGKRAVSHLPLRCLHSARAPRVVQGAGHQSFDDKLVSSLPALPKQNGYSNSSLI